MTLPDEALPDEALADPTAAEPDAGEEQPLHAAQLMRPTTETSIEVFAFEDDWSKLVIEHDDGGDRHRETLFLPRAEAKRIGRELLEWAEGDDA